MNTNLIPTGNDSATVMSSREIAELCEKRHDHVIRDVEKMLATLEIDAPKFGAVYQDSKGETRKEYRLPKDLTLTLVSGYKVELRFKIVKRLEALEGGAAPKVDLAKSPALAREARLQHKHFMGIGKMIGLTGNQLAISASTATERAIGFNPLGAMGVTHMTAPEPEALLTPSDMAEDLGLSSGRAVNLLLTEEGYQKALRTAKGKPYYEPTTKGIGAGAVMQDTGKSHGDGTPIRQLKWSSGVVDALQGEMA